MRLHLSEPNVIVLHSHDLAHFLLYAPAEQRAWLRAHSALTLQQSALDADVALRSALPKDAHAHVYRGQLAPTDGDEDASTRFLRLFAHLEIVSCVRHPLDQYVSDLLYQMSLPSVLVAMRLYGARAHLPRDVRALRASMLPRDRCHRARFALQRKRRVHPHELLAYDRRVWEQHDDIGAFLARWKRHFGVDPLAQPEGRCTVGRDGPEAQYRVMRFEQLPADFPRTRVNQDRMALYDTAYVDMKRTLRALLLTMAHDTPMHHTASELGYAWQ